jgi:hypothetical protein
VNGTCGAPAAVDAAWLQLEVWREMVSCCR